MKIFLSHASRDKPLVREIVSYLPESLTIWIDEKDLPIGTELASSLKETITSDSDIVILFISQEAVSSNWVKNELSWALKREEELGHRFIFPVVIDSDAWDKIEPSEFQKRKYIKLNDFTIDESKNLANKLEREIFNWLVEQKNNSVKLPERLKEFDLDIDIKAGNLIRMSDLLNDNNIPSNKGVVVVFGIDDHKEIHKKNSIEHGLPLISVEVVNKGADIEIQSVNLIFNKDSEINNEEIIDGKVNPNSIFAIDLSSGFPQTATKHIKSNHKEFYNAHEKIIMGIILTRGIKEVVVTDVSGNTYKANKNDIIKAEKYLKTFFEYDGLDKLYEYYKS